MHGRRRLWARSFARRLLPRTSDLTRAFRKRLKAESEREAFSGEGLG